MTEFFGKTALGLVFKALEHLPSLLSFQKALKTQTRPESRRRFKHTHNSETEENGTSNLGDHFALRKHLLTHWATTNPAGTMAGADHAGPLSGFPADVERTIRSHVCP